MKITYNRLNEPIKSTAELAYFRMNTRKLDTIGKRIKMHNLWNSTSFVVHLN